jgi:hypothetical protein
MERHWLITCRWGLNEQEKAERTEERTLRFLGVLLFKTKNVQTPGVIVSIDIQSPADRRLI